MTNSKKRKLLQTTIKRGEPIRFEELDGDVTVDSHVPSATQQKTVDAIAKTLAEYIRELNSLMNGKYAGLRHWVPPHFYQPTLVTAWICDGGLAIRYEPTSEKTQVAVGFVKMKFNDMVTGFSGGLIHLHETEPFEPTKTGMSFALGYGGTTGNLFKPLIKAEISWDILLKKPPTMPSPPEKPYCLARLVNRFQFRVEYFVVSADQKLSMKKRMASAERRLAVTEIQLNTGWDRIEIYPFFIKSSWKPSFAKVWAEKDILEAALAYQLRENSLKTLDPNADARREASRLLAEFQQLLDSNPDREEILQDYLKKNPKLLCPSYVEIYPKLKLGQHVTDFVFKTSYGDYWLVELEPSDERLFTNKNTKSGRLNGALEQVSDWERYIEDNLSTVRNELGLTEITSSSKKIVVIGRSRTLSNENRRKLQVFEKSSPNTKIMTYDDVLFVARTTFENMLGSFSTETGTTRIFNLK